MSSMRNAVQRRNHRERAQPLNRQKWGLLEKHKDYSLRAKDHKEKQKRLKILREKAANANPDEFSFKMMSSRTKNGVRIGDRGNKTLSHEVVSLLKTQDAGYIRTMLQKTRKEREALERELVLEESGAFMPLMGSGHDGEEDEFAARMLKYVDSKDEIRALIAAVKSEGDEAEDTDAEDRAPLQRSRRDAEAARVAQVKMVKIRSKRLHRQEVRRRLLEAVRERERDLAAAADELDLQRAKMSNSVGGVTKTGQTFKIKERKR